MAAQTLILKDNAGNILGEFRLGSTGVPTQVEALEGVYYQLSDANGRAPTSVSGERQGNDLLVTIDGSNSLIIKNYYTNGQGALVGIQTDGTPHNMFLPLKWHPVILGRKTSWRRQRVQVAMAIVAHHLPLSAA